jgi:C_GCAxxG_C_C family probable redox protein
MARSLKETCGAVSGGLLALGYLWGRDSAREKWDKVEKPAMEFRKRFIDEFGSANCARLLEDTKGVPDPEICTRLVAKTAVILMEVIEKHQRP